MPHDLPKAYDPAAIEDHWAEYWVREKLFTQPTPEPGENVGKPFTILLPPPNVTGRLHMGHMLNQTEMDILTRWHRMLGDTTLWLPGTDHAGIATQMMVERQLVSEGTSRKALGRNAFECRVWKWRELYGGAILDQMKRLGASVDWQREYFTMDARLSVAVREAFTRLYEQGLIYRGAYVVNWCPSCQTAISDLEVVHEEVLGKLWEIRYPVLGMPGEFLTIATTRPETMLGDVAVAIHPEDERYLHLHGKNLLLPLVNREIPIVLDDWVSRDFGTGAVKVTPAHDPNDFALGQRHHLPSINIMDDTAHINEAGGPYAGLERYKARERVLEDLAALGLLGTIHDHKLSVGRCDRSKDVVEPRLSTQWFIKIQPLADRAIEAVEKGHIKFTPDQYKKTYLNWMTNIHDWCISRQLWWGHRIPAWHCADCNKITVPAPGDIADPSACMHCGSEQIRQETDVLDTWFSSGLLPVSVFGWPFRDNQPSIDFAMFYPTSLLVTGFDILFFWVARMIMLGCWFALDVPEVDGSTRSLARSVPFKDVYIHALVRDANREKMSKTKGNVIDPIEIVKQYGTDAVRFTLASMASPGTDIAFNVERTQGYRAFANKIWNAARFIFMNLDRAREAGIKVDLSALDGRPFILDPAPLEARWIASEFHKTAAEVNKSLANYRFDDAANTIYQFFWGSFCDWYLEIVKLRLDFSESANQAATQEALTTLLSVFEASLRLLSPFMPFLTEEIWHAIYDSNPPRRSIALTRYPQTDKAALNAKVLNGMTLIQNLIVEIRALRKERNVPEKESVHVVYFVSKKAKDFIEEHMDIVQPLAKVSAVESQSSEYLSARPGSRVGYSWKLDIDDGAQTDSTDESTQVSPQYQPASEEREPLWMLDLEYERTIDVPAERERLTKEIAKLEKGLTAAERQLGNEAFLSKAPASIVEGLKKQEGETRLLLEKTRRDLDSLPPA